ncbi:MAG: glutathione S-transferase N-terminal domain-containing protein [Robiginitomaculum sp.]|nr:glutathione S-transferase N-terminal domain-containing protein [Robiginitomaculum sp.]
MPYQLIAAPLSLYSGKVRGYLRWKNVAFSEVLSTAKVYKSIILPRVGWPVVPVLISPDDTTVQDSSEIIDYVENAEPGASVYPDTPVQKLVALIMELFGDEWLLISAMHYRWTYNEDYAYGQFGKASAPELSKQEQADLGKKLASRFKGSLPFLGITEKTAPAIEKTYEAFLRTFDQHLAEHDFLLGSQPSIGDFGLLGPLYAHNYRDPASGAMMEKIAPRVADWCRRTHAPQQALSGEFLADDEVPETLLPILRMFAGEQLPILLDTLDDLKKWLSENPDTKELPRITGFHKYKIDGVEEDRAVLPFSLWMLQRVLDHLASLSGDDRKFAAELLTKIGAEELLSMQVTPRLKRESFKLILA